MTSSPPPPSSHGPTFPAARKGYERAAVDAEMIRLHAALREQRIRTLEAERRMAEAEQEALALRRHGGGGGAEIGEKAAGLLREIAELERNLRSRAVEEADSIVHEARQQAAAILSEAQRGGVDHEAIARRAALERTLAELEDDRAALIGQLEWLAAHLMETTGRLRTEGPQVAGVAQVIDLRNPGGTSG